MKSRGLVGIKLTEVNCICQVGTFNLSLRSEENQSCKKNSNPFPQGNWQTCWEALPKKGKVQCRHPMQRTHCFSFPRDNMRGWGGGSRTSCPNCEILVQQRKAVWSLVLAFLFFLSVVRAKCGKLMGLVSSALFYLAIVWLYKRRNILVPSLRLSTVLFSSDPLQLFSYCMNLLQERKKDGAGGYRTNKTYS